MDFETQQIRIRQSRNGDVTLFSNDDVPLVRIQFFHGFATLDKEEKATLATSMLSILAENTDKKVEQVLETEDGNEHITN